jgi:hypothetical protein
MDEYKIGANIRFPPTVNGFCFVEEKFVFALMVLTNFTILGLSLYLSDFKEDIYSENEKHFTIATRLKFFQRKMH